MKRIYFIALTAFLSGSAMAQKTDLMKDKILIGEVKNDKFKVVVDTKSFLLAMNEQFDGDYDHVEIKTDHTLGEKKEKFYYVNVSSGSDGSSIVRWLSNKNGRLYMENSTGDDTTHKDFYVSCKGVDKCTPHLYADNKKMNWICGEKPGCLTEEEAKRNPCRREISLVAPSE